MNWQQFWDEQAGLHQQPHEQVARTGTSLNNASALTDTITSHIIQLLDLRPEDRLLDVCCGNGILTQRLAQFCQTVTAVDISAKQLEIARQNYPRENINYLQADVLTLTDTLQTPFDKINLYFSFQYMDSFQKGEQAINQMLQLLNPQGIILLGDVPDHAYLRIFYPKFGVRLRYQLARLLGRDQMGRFWKQAELEKIASQHHAAFQRLTQPRELPYSHYRVDYLIRKNEDIPG